MHIHTTALIITCVLILTIPIFLFIKQDSKENHALKKTFLDLAEKNEMHLDQVELTPNLLLGLDRNSKKFIYTSHNKPQENYHIIDLNQVEEINLIVPENVEQSIEKVAIEFKGKTPTTVIFYDDLTSMGADGTVCEYIAQKWVDLLRKA